MQSGFQRTAGRCEAADDFMELASELCRRRSRVSALGRRQRFISVTGWQSAGILSEKGMISE